MNSLNHYAFGSIGDWMYRKLAGINQLEPGYKKILIKPCFIRGITSVEASYESVYGEIKSSWSCKNHLIKINIKIPCNTTAILELPTIEDKIEVGSGSYYYEYETDISLERDRYSIDSTLKEIIEEPLAREILNKYVPDLLNHPMIEYAFSNTISEFLKNAPQIKPLFENIIDILNKQSST